MGLRSAIVAAVLVAPAVLAQQQAWQQCGGVNYSGVKTCVAGTTCVFINDYYSQCQPGNGPSSSSSRTTSTSTTTSSGFVTITTTASGPVTTPTGGQATGNPFLGYQAYANPYYSSEIHTHAIPTLVSQGKTALAAKATEVANIGTFVWLDTRAKVPTIEGYLADIRAKNAAGANPPILAPLVVYNLPDRDCAARASNGELAIANNGIALYKQYVDSIHAIISKYTDVNIVLVIEPDSLANLVTNMNVAKCQGAASAYKECTAYTLTKLNLPHVTMYLDGGHAGWLGWPNNLAPAAKVWAEVYKTAGSPHAVRGLVTNVANYNAYSATTCAPVTQQLAGINGICDEKKYINALTTHLNTEGFPAHFLVDVGRSGKQPTGQAEWGHWCNIKGTGFGPKPSTNTNDPLVDALVWVKPGGESDGTSDQSATRYDSMCGSSSSFTPAPEAGTWFQAYFEQLLTNAAF